jgi:hypothetical protein
MVEQNRFAEERARLIKERRDAYFAVLRWAFGSDLTDVAAGLREQLRTAVRDELQGIEQQH